MRSIFEKGPATDPWMQLVRYLFTGGVSFFVDFSLLYLLTEFVKLPVLIAATLSFTCGLATNYLFCIKWVFNKRNVKNRWLEFLLFSLIGVIGLGLNILFIWLFTKKVPLHYLIAKIIATAFVYLWNFSAKKLLLF